MREAWDSRWSSRLKVSSGIHVQLVVRAEMTDFLSLRSRRAALPIVRSHVRSCVAFRPETRARFAFLLGRNANQRVATPSYYFLNVSQ